MAKALGRPPLGEKALDAQVKVVLHNSIIEWIDLQRGGLSRSAYLRAMIDSFKGSQLAQSRLNKQIRGAA